MRKLREIFRFELVYQARRLSTWLVFAVLVAVAYLAVRANYLYDAREGDFLLNSTFVITAVTTLGCLVWVLVGAGVAGDAATRDVGTGMSPLTYTAPVRKADYLGGRFLAAFVLNAAILLALPAGTLLALHWPGAEPDILGPFRPAAYLSAYAFVALPDAFVATAIQFSLAALGRRALPGYLGGVLLFLAARAIGPLVALGLGMWELGKLLDPVGVFGVLSEMANAWTPVEKNTRLLALQGSWLANRLFWVAIALGVFAFSLYRFRFAHAAGRRWWRRRRRADAPAAGPADAGATGSVSIRVPQTQRAFGDATHARQTLVIARTSFWAIAKSRIGLVLAALVGMLVMVAVPGNMTFMGLPLLPRAEHILTFLTSSLANPGNIAWSIIPLLTVLYAGELIWRERDAGMSELTDAAPVPEGVLLLGKFLGLALVLAAWMAFLTAAATGAQLFMGSPEPEVGVFARVLFGLQLPDYLLFGLLALVVHVLVDQKHVGHLVAFLAYGAIVYGHALGLEHHLLVYGSHPDWSYTDMAGFGATLGPWLSFEAYWGASAAVLAVVARLLWVRGTERSFRSRLHQARLRFTRPTAAAAAGAAGLVLASGGFVFYNTNVLNDYRAASERTERRAEYERRYGRYEDAPQPRLTAVTLDVEILPERQAASIQGTYRLLNAGSAPIDSVHLATEVELEQVSFDRPTTAVLEDADLGYRIYALQQPLRPGDTLALRFEMHIEPHGFRNSGVDSPVAANGTALWSHDWLPAIGYQPGRELHGAAERRFHGLTPRPVISSPYDAPALPNRPAPRRIDFEAFVGTDESQIAVAPGTLRRTWTEGGRRYFQYATDAPVWDDYAIFSADWAVREARWNHVAIRIFHHPGHTANLDRMVRAVRDSLTNYTGRFGPYPYGVIRLLEQPGHGLGMHSEAMTINHQEGFTLLDPDGAPWRHDLVFSVVAHEVAHQWWGAQLPYAPVEGAALLTESLATYSTLGVVEKTFGAEKLARYVRWLRQMYEVPRARSAPPLLRATDGFLAYRKGPLALYALSRYIGSEPIDEALRRLLDEHRAEDAPPATSLDLYRKLQAVTPDSLQSLLHDLFEANTFWDLETERATAKRTEAGTWKVTLDVRGRKVVVDTEGVETGAAMDDLIEVGVFAPAEDGTGLGEPLFLQKRRIRSGEQTITVTVPRRPARAGIDPYHLLDSDTADNTERVESES